MPRPIREQRPPESLNFDGKQRMCPSCSIRFVLGPPKREIPAEITIAPAAVHNLEGAARDFDEMADESDETFTALDFIDWIKPDLTWRRREPAS